MQKIEKTSFKISEPVKLEYKLDGKNDFMDIDEIYFKAPTRAERDICRGLKKKFMEAMFGMTASASPEEAQRRIDTSSSSKVKDEVPDAQAIKVIMFASKDFNIGDYIKRFIVLFERVAFKDDELKQPLTSLDFEKFDNENDIEDLIAHYIQVFFIVSWMKTIS
jgi:hypothetical protein